MEIHLPLIATRIRDTSERTLRLGRSSLAHTLFVPQALEFMVQTLLGGSERSSKSCKKIAQVGKQISVHDDRS